MTRRTSPPGKGRIQEKTQPTRRRKSIPKETEAKVLLHCRRRCCICYGLHVDKAIKKGQVAHLDRNPSNNGLDNLAFLCLEHHDEYDSHSSQSKNFTPNEVRKLRIILHEAIDRIWRESAWFDIDTLDPISRIAGHYIRDGKLDSAELDITSLGSGRIRVQGLALWGEYAPNVGQLDFEGQVHKKKIVFSREVSRKTYRVEITFHKDRLLVCEDYVIGLYGMNVSFAGEYRKMTRQITEATEV